MPYVTRLLLFVLLVGVSLQTSNAQHRVKKVLPATTGNDPAKVFLSPPASAKPGVLWMWMGSNLSKEGITRDLEALKKEGFNRTTMFSLSDVTTPWAGAIGNSATPDLISWTEPWWQMVRHAAKESKRLGMDFGMFNGPGYESSGGPWITPELSMQEICWTSLPVAGNKSVTVTLKQPAVDLRGHTPWPINNPITGIPEIPKIPSRGTYYKDIAVLALPEKGIVAPNEVIDLTQNMLADGSLNWNAPPGNWIIYRFGHTTSGTLMQPAQWQATGLECDKMSQEAMDFHLDHVIGEIKKHLGDLIGTGFTHLHFDSYEAGVPTWTAKMPEEFLTRRGYSLLPYLPVFAGRVIGNGKADSLKFISDFSATVKDLYRDIYFKTIARKTGAANLTFLCEPYGGPWRQDEIMPLVKSVMTEFWTHGGNYSPYELEATVASLRKSGQNIVEAEAFTGDPTDSKWNETPAWLKPIGDAAFCAGVNRFILHRFVEQPWSDKYQPGATMGQWGTHFDRTQTWWKPGKAMVEYWQRCQALLQWGKIAQPDAEDLLLTGDETTKAVKFIHRKEGQTNVYFIANTSRKPVSVTCNFKIEGMQPELWNPVTKEMYNVHQSASLSGRTIINLNFAEAQSFFIVFRKKAAPPQQMAGTSEGTTGELLTLNGPWKVQFDQKWGGPARPVLFTQLDDWIARPEKGIKYFSGTAVYTKNFDLTGSKNLKNNQSGICLDLGVVHALARVRINNTDLGVVWTAPWNIKIPRGLLKTKNNQLVIEVTNVWANRLIGDEQEPPDCEWLPGGISGRGSYLKAFPAWFIADKPRPSAGRYCFTTWNYFTKDSPLVSSGLLGPVRILKQAERN